MNRKITPVILLLVYFLHFTTWADNVVPIDIRSMEERAYEFWSNEMSGLKPAILVGVTYDDSAIPYDGPIVTTLKLKATSDGSILLRRACLEKSTKNNTVYELFQLDLVITEENQDGQKEEVFVCPGKFSLSLNKDTIFKLRIHSGSGRGIAAFSMKMREKNIDISRRQEFLSWAKASSDMN